MTLPCGRIYLSYMNGYDELRDGLHSRSLDTDLHATTKTQYQVEGRLILNVVVRQGAPINKLPASKDETLLHAGDALKFLLRGESNQFK